MHFFKTVLASAALAASVVAKDPGTLAFSSFPSDVSAGTPVPLTWSGGNSDAPVTITLRRGPSKNLKDVAELTSSATGGSWKWTPAKDLESGDDYALQITQGDKINYSSQFSIKGDAPSGPASSAPAPSGDASGTTTITMTLTSCASSTPAPTPPTVVPSSSAVSSTISPPRNTTMPTMPTMSASPSPTAPTEQLPLPTGGSVASAMLSTPLILVAGIVAGFAYID